MIGFDVRVFVGCTVEFHDFTGGDADLDECHGGVVNYTPVFDAAAIPRHPPRQHPDSFFAVDDHFVTIFGMSINNIDIEIQSKTSRTFEATVDVITYRACVAAIALRAWLVTRVLIVLRGFGGNPGVII